MDVGPLYRTRKGVQYLGDSEDILKSKWFLPLQKKVDLIFTSPPFPLNSKKKYGNLNGNEYINWLSNYANIFNDLLNENGSLVIELGNSWESGIPAMSIVSIEALLALKEKGKYYLCQEFIWNNTSSLPNPAQWVNIERIRLKNSFSRLWWLSKTPRPKANNRKVLIEYSHAMKQLIKGKKYNSGKRPSGHNVGEKSFYTDNGGAIPTNVLHIPNTTSNGPYNDFCKNKNIKHHPARMPIELAKFFIHFLTEIDDVVLDPFSGSNITGLASEELGRKWRSIEKDYEYAISSKARFPNSWNVKRNYREY